MKKVPRVGAVASPLQGDHVFNDLGAPARKATDHLNDATNRLGLTKNLRIAESSRVLAGNRQRFEDLRNHANFATAMPARRPTSMISSFLESKGLGGDRNSQRYSVVSKSIIDGVIAMASGEPSRISDGSTKLLRIKDNIADMAFDASAAKRVRDSIESSSGREEFDRFIADGKNSLTSVVEGLYQMALELNRARIEHHSNTEKGDRMIANTDS